MLFSKLFAFASAATMVAQTNADFSYNFSSYFDFTGDITDPFTCKPIELFSFGDHKNLYFDVNLKRELEENADLIVLESLDKRATTIPKADFSVSDVEKVAGNLFKVTINFETIASADLLDILGVNAGTAVVAGLGVGTDESQLIAGASSEGNIGDLFQWSATILVNATIKGDLFCLPEGFSIELNIDFDAAVDSPLLEALEKALLPSNIIYKLEQDLSNAAESILGKREISDAIVGHEKRALASLSDEFNAGLNISSLGTLDNILPNFCWKGCEVSSSSVASSSAATSSAASSSSEVSTVTVVSSSAESSSAASSSEVVTVTVASSSEASSSEPSSDVSTVFLSIGYSADPSSAASSTEESSAEESSAVSGFTEYTTGGASSLSDGEVVTSSYDVIVTTDSVGSLTTESSFLGASTYGPSVTESSSGAVTVAAESSAVSDPGAKVAGTVTDVVGTTVITITSCSEDKCHATAVTTGLTTVCEEDTSYVTYCPLTTAAEETPASTVITVSGTPVTTGVTTVTEDTTTYVTYCPLTSTVSPATVAPTSTAPASAAPASSAPTVVAAASTGTTLSQVASSTPSTVAAESTVAVSSFEGMANGFSVSLGALFAGIFVVFNI